MLSRTQIRQFLAVVDTGGFTKAANALNVAQPSLSAGIAELERQLGTRLFVRERRRIRLTEAGTALLAPARAIERGFHQVETQIGSLPVAVRPIRLGVLDTVSSSWLERIFMSYAASDPIELTEGSERELHTARARGTLDLALTLVSSERRSEESELLFSEDYCLALPADHPLAKAERVRPEDVAGETMIARRSCEMLADTSRFFTDRGVRPRFSLRSHNDDRVMAMVRAGLGVTVAPRSLGSAGIAMVRLEDFDARRRIGLAFASHWTGQYGLDHPLLKAFRDACPSRAAPA